IKRSVKSALCQKNFQGEIIVVDDGSGDLTKKSILQLQKEEDVTINYIYQENKGPASARNLGLKAAKYDFIAFLDSDDHWHPKKIQKQLEWMQKNDHFLICHTYEKWLRRGEHLNQKKKHLPRHGNIFEHCLQLCAVGMSTVIVKKQLFEEVGFFDESLPCCEDYEFWLRVSAHFEFLLLEEPLTIKEGGRKDQVSNIYRLGMDKFRIKALCNLLDSVVLNREQRLLTLAELKKKCMVYGNGCKKHGKLEEGTFFLQLIEGYEKNLD
ncbi:MAG: glycosyltransferase family 2 protein, partial [Bacteroidetes bacterium]|nr:glycosyltransferase family 2 protein [Bacteroidota bacterium]